MAGFERDIYFYGVLGGLIGLGNAGGIPKPKKGYAKRIIDKFNETIVKAIARERISLEAQKPYLEWFRGHSYTDPGFYLGTERNDGLEGLSFLNYVDRFRSMAIQLNDVQHQL